jgi:hypothetical protein
MRKAKKNDRNLATLGFMLSGIPNIWSATTVESEPQKWLDNWQVYKAVKANIQPELFGYHFVGHDVRGCHGAVSSKIDRFDPVKMSGVTLSGRVYQLVGMPGVDQDAQYTLAGWIVRNELVMEDATEEFIRYYKIDSERMREMDVDKS